VGGDLAVIVELEAALARLLERGDGARPDPAWLACARRWSAAVWEHAEQMAPAPLTAEAVERGLALARRPVFVCGAHRSGTSLVRNLLDGHPALAVLPSEGTFYTHIERRLAGLSPHGQAAEMGQEWLRRLANPGNQPPFWLLGRSGAEASPYVEFARELAAWWPLLRERAGDRRGLWPLVAVVLAYAERIGAGGAVRWVEKTPTNEQNLARLWAEFPEARVIHLVRRPEDALASHKAVMGARWRPGREVAAIYRNLTRSLRIAHQQLRAAPPERYLLLRYEDLAGNPAEAAGRLAVFLDIDPLPSLLEPTVATLPVRPNSSFADDRQRAERRLTRLERAVLTLATGRAAARLGYD